MRLGCDFHFASIAAIRLLYSTRFTCNLGNGVAVIIHPVINDMYMRMWLVVMPEMRGDNCSYTYNHLSFNDGTPLYPLSFRNQCFPNCYKEVYS